MAAAQYDNLISLVKQGIARSRSWAETGWPVTFGPGGVEVSSLQQALDLPENFVYREEALDYWHTVEQMGREAAACGEKALTCLEKGDLNTAEDWVYQALFIERPCVQYSVTWRAIHKSVSAMLRAE